MFQDAPNHDLIRKYIAYFAAVFANVYVRRNSLTDGSELARIKVPLHYAKVEHALERVIEDPNIDRKDAIVLPAMSYSLENLAYANDRHNATRNRFAVKLAGDPNRLGVMHAAAPYDFHFQLGVLVKNQADAFDIIEEIAAYFTPDFTATLQLIPEMNVTHEVPIVLEQTALDFQIPKEYEQRVTYMAVFDFVVQGFLYGPEKKWPLIKFANVSINVDGSTPALSAITTPGLTANGQPTSDANSSVNYLTIYVDDDYGYVETVRQNTAMFKPGANT